ncbi:nuclear transport factor 2 family protein [Flavobacterium pallidum]|uniref:Steroid delta-isomerase n=1 Tax=Flavobacterium pallidum TaxID=2172098 RepID=A0A2S1SKX2_9FLAO|nr:nuclear transport factor 2 family protein [Flavobacterium pallidum]AWI26987.1 steroid delta-isomerase [Flavobacterium pallidum]
MTPKQVLQQWLEHFNNADIENISNLYAEDAVNHQVANEPVVGKAAISDMFAREFGNADMVCIPENIFEDKEWAILEWKDPKDMRGCGFFQIQNDKIIFQRGYWDKLSFHRLYNIPLDMGNTGQDHL